MKIALNWLQQLVKGVTLVSLLTGCAARETRQAFQTDLSLKRCDDALLHLPEHDPMIKLQKKSEQAAGTVLSYTFVGASYTAELLLDVVGGTVMLIGLCGPTLVALSASSSTNQFQLACLPGPTSALSAPPLGRQAKRKTGRLRCPNLLSLSQSLRAVASCYEQQGGDENLVKAEKTLAGSKQSVAFYTCLPESEQAEVQSQLTRIQGLLHQTNKL